MCPDPSTTSRLKGRRRLLQAIASLGFLALLCGLTLAWWRWHVREPIAAPDEASTFHSPYRNVEPQVKYVGDQVCADCHWEKWETYRRHPMGHSLAPVGQVAAQLGYDAKAHNPFDQLGFHFSVQKNQQRIIHQESRLDSQGRVAAQHEDEIHFALGSGSRGYSFLFERGGFLFQSPISWFSQGKVWDLSPGFRESLVSGRQIKPECLFCHANYVKPDADTVNRYEKPLFPRGYAIGCERCHGPGELHVARRTSGEVFDGLDDTIVNPRRLEPMLREGVCQQCHLQGQLGSGIVRRGQEVFDYRPGLPLHQFRSIFVLPAQMTDDLRAVGQVEQMYSSRCYRASQGRLGCISCHDPHVLPAPEKRSNYFRQRCLNCHQEESCGLPVAARQQTNPEDSCILCHMPPFANSNIAHSASTDHRIRRRPEKMTVPASRGLPDADMPVKNFFEPILDPDDPEPSRALGLVLAELASEVPAFRRKAASHALELLESALESYPDDLPAWEAKAGALWLLERKTEALATIEFALSQAPRREAALRMAALFASGLRRDEKAAAYWKRVLVINPWRPSDHFHLAENLHNGRQPRQAAEECQAALRIEPANVKTRLLLVKCYLQTGQKDLARAEFDTLLSLKPPDADQLRRWFAEQLR
jgi:hypothetical protein